MRGGREGGEGEGRERERGKGERGREREGRETGGRTVTPIRLLKWLDVSKLKDAGIRPLVQY